ncbi:MAG TPA: hypothetical protein VGB42_12095, partial [Candidatus Thermoplasmatota archaeon]
GEPEELGDGGFRDAWFEAPLAPGWTVAYRLVRQGSAVVVGEVRVFPHELGRESVPGCWSAEVLGAQATVPPGGLTARLLRRLRIGAHYRVAAEAFDRLAEDAVLGEDARAAVGLAKLPQRPPGPSRPGRPRGLGLRAARLARAYVELVARGSVRPVAELAPRVRLTPSQVRDALRDARERGYLTSPGQGKRGGSLVVPLAVQRVLARTKSHRSGGPRTRRPTRQAR